MASWAEGHSGHYVAAQGYSDKRRLEAPRVNVPPPDLNYRNGKPTFRVHGLPYNRTSRQYGNHEFLRALVSSHRFDLAHSMLTWQYEMRRNAQAILPFLFLGPSSVARDPAFICDTGITLLVAARSGKSVRTRKSFLDPATFASSAGIASWTFDFDHPAEFISLVKPVIRAINDHLEATCARIPIRDIHDVRGKVLIFCESGNDRSALLVAAYLMVVYGVEAIAAIHMIQSQRFCITLSDDMKNILLDLQTITTAERQVSDADSAVMPFIMPSNDDGNVANRPRRPSKRNIDEFYTSDDEIGNGVGQLMETDIREGVAPFVDVAD
ncbi:hypothetical protein G647_00354 [Cladophialophora carrionii CBS 160.54]|uniref:Tyrosine specific protein phosphatases domain-containing protein n=1 Tax=Cladophialophora carrionii CBS 160.54 TaxID=1279043 RepID=V9DM22_9EURO|nr:uncharacterized protein G647_00354 [Cladophialophora carrionii CBS 160.54]ETI27905.1 hypothetical protein G647_00354 [Cladophialophora carrionii CBS 160.54]